MISIINLLAEGNLKALPAKSPMEDVHTYVRGRMASLKAAFAAGRLHHAEYNQQMNNLKRSMFNKKMGTTEF
ncbi:MAG: hypothetical protein PHD05_00860 [Sphaerochaetaceae bacterium]|nr:hypothetical protein [Sphaerochaetaceae bacterium]